MITFKQLKDAQIELMAHLELLGFEPNMYDLDLAHFKKIKDTKEKAYLVKWYNPETGKTELNSAYYDTFSKRFVRTCSSENLESIKPYVSPEAQTKKKLNTLLKTNGSILTMGRLLRGKPYFKNAYDYINDLGSEWDRADRVKLAILINK